MISTATGGVVINYSSRFSIPGMTGTFPVTVQSALKSISGTAGPATQNQIAAVNDGSSAASGTDAAGGFGVAYSLQSGPTRYAPMPKQPPTSITMKNPTPLYASSAWTVWTEVGGPPNAQITVTQPVTYIVSSAEPTVSGLYQSVDSRKLICCRLRLQPSPVTTTCRNSLTDGKIELSDVHRGLIYRQSLSIGVGHAYVNTGIKVLDISEVISKHAHRQGVATGVL